MALVQAQVAVVRDDGLDDDVDDDACDVPRKMQLVLVRCNQSRHRRLRILQRQPQR